MYRSSYGQNEEITSELYHNEWMESGQAEMGKKVQGFCLIYSENFHHREWKLASTEILITSFYHKKSTSPSSTSYQQPFAELSNIYNTIQIIQNIV